jgi:hypothetical protein
MEYEPLDSVTVQSCEDEYRLALDTFPLGKLPGHTVHNPDILRVIFTFPHFYDCLFQLRITCKALYAPRLLILLTLQVMMRFVRASIWY